MAEGGTPETADENSAIQEGLLEGQLKFSSMNLKYQIEEYIKCGKPVKILLSGKTGVGKSHLTNALIGEELAEEGEDFDPKTDEVTAYEFIKNNVRITVFDTPGFADTTGNDEEYLRKIKEKGNDFDLFLFCTEMNNTRFRNDDLETMAKLTSTLGVQLWDHALVVLTFANIVPVSPSYKAKGFSEKDIFSDHFLRLKRRIQQTLTQIGVPEQAAVSVPFVPAGDSTEPRLADRDNWLTAFWVEAFKRMNKNAKAAFLRSNADRITFPSVLDANEENQECGTLRILENYFKEVSFEKNGGTSRLNPIQHIAAREQSNQPPQKQIIERSASSTIQVNESCSRSIVDAMVGDVTGTSPEESNSPVFTRFYQKFLKLLIKLLKTLSFSSENEESLPVKNAPSDKKGKSKKKD
ncbi:uncharacterized protein LOC144660258 [Oculina patagonica]